MPRFEYKVITAPRRGERMKGARTPVDRFAQTLTQLMNDLGQEGWEYLRAETLPCEERVGFTGKTTTFQNLLIFRRALAEGEPPAAGRPAAPGALTLRGPTVDAPEGQAPALGPARGGLAAE